MCTARAAAGTKARRSAQPPSIWFSPIVVPTCGHVGRDEAVAEASQVLFFNALEGYRVSHPIAGGDATLDLLVNEALLRELAPKALLKGGASPGVSRTAPAN